MLSWANHTGTGIALVSARNAKVPVQLFDADPKALSKSLTFLGLTVSPAATDVKQS